VWPPVQDGAIRLSAAQLGLLLEGLDWSRVRPKLVIAPYWQGDRTLLRRLNYGKYNRSMLCEAGKPPQYPVLLQAQVAGLTSMLEERTSAVPRLRGERDALRTERDAFRTERDTANAESLPRRRPG